ncbi:MAG: hypothetical protein ACLQNE_20190 [Thermoguttaceae bacterium]
MQPAARRATCLARGGPSYRDCGESIHAHPQDARFYAEAEGEESLAYPCSRELV